MKIAIIGAAGNIGQRITNEALQRNHEVTAIVRNPEKVKITNANLKVVKGDVDDTKTLAEQLKGFDAVVSSIGPPHDGSVPASVINVAARSVLEAFKESGAKRLLVVGGAGSLKIPTGEDLVDTPSFPAIYKEVALHHREVLKEIRKSDANWTYFSPAGLILPGERTGKFRVDTENLVIDDKGESFISIEDYAVAMIDEIENPKFERNRFTAGY